MVEVLGGQILNLAFLGQHLLHLGGEQEHLAQNVPVLLRLNGAQSPGKVQPQQVEHRQLGTIRLGGGHGDLRPGPGVQHHIRLPGDGGAHHIDDGQHLGPQTFGLPQSGHGVQGLAGLADDHHQGVLIHNGLHVSELGGQGHLHGLAQQPLQVVLAHHAHMVGGAAGHNVQLLEVSDLLIGEGEVLQVHLPVLNAGEDGAAQRLGLLHDLLGHEVLVAALFGGVHLPVHPGDLLGDGLEQAVVALDALGGEHRHLPVLHIDDVPGVAENGGDVRGQEVGLLPQPQNQGAVLAHGDELVGLVAAQDAQGIGALNAVEHPAHRRQQIPLIEVFHQLGHHLAVRLGDKGHPLGLEEAFELGIVFDDAVVHHRNLAAVADMGVGVGVRGRPVGGPTGVTDADGARNGTSALDHVREYLQTSLGLGHPHLSVMVYRHSGGVIPSVFQAGQAVQQNGRRLLPPHISYNSTHIASSLYKFLKSRHNARKGVVSRCPHRSEES